jgi:ribosomal protein S18 acetylase RimI-like enzyme
MEYKLVKSTKDDLDKIIEYKKQTIFDFADNLSQDEIDKINNYVETTVPELIEDYYKILVNGNIIGCLLITDKDDGKLLDEIYLEEEYRNQGIGTGIIASILNKDKIVYLWVYKANTNAIKLYERLGFKVIEETDTRYYMKYSKDS